jgi:hypothetical protein
MLADTDTIPILADANLATGYPMQLVVDGHQSLDIDWQKFPANGKNGSRW